MTTSDDDRRGGLSTTARVAIVGVAVVLLVGGFLVARGGGDDGGSAGAGSAAAPQATPPASQSPQTPAADEPGYTDPVPGPKAEAPTVRTIRVRGGAPVGEAKTLRYRRGDRIRLRVTSDAPGEVHVHGFDVEKPVSPSAPARFNIEADIEGRFEVELHGSDTLIATLEVRPKS